MSPLDNNPTRPGPSAEPTKPTNSAAQLAHELANLLDGSLRHLGIVINTLRGPDDSAEQTRPAQPKTDDELLTRLQTADQSMKQMVSLIHKWIKHAPDPSELYEQGQTLGQTLKQVVAVHRPSAERYEIDLSLSVTREVASLPAGPVFPVIANAVRNSIEAIADSGPDHGSSRHRIQIDADVQAGQVCLTVSDDGPGLDRSMCDAQGRLVLGRSTKPGGHGMGLALSDQIAQSLGGTLELINRPPRGAALILRYPQKGVGALASHEAPPGQDGRNP